MLGYSSRVGAFEIRVRHHARTAVAGPADVDHVQVVLLDDAIAVHVDEIEPGRGAPVSQQPRLDVLQAQRLGQQRIVVEINLADRQVVGGAPVRIDFTEFAG